MIKLSLEMERDKECAEVCITEHDFDFYYYVLFEDVHINGYSVKVCSVERTINKMLNHGWVIKKIWNI